MTPRFARSGHFAPILLALALASCGGSEEESTLPDESGDFTAGGMRSDGNVLAGTRRVGPELGGTRWRWSEAHCTEGPLDLAARGFQREARVDADQDGLLFLYDQRWGDGCAETLAQRARPNANASGEFGMREEAHVDLPNECGVPAEDDRMGDVRMRGELLEIYVQRSVWCNGFEVRMVYEPLPAGAPLEPEQAIRHWAVHYNRKDVNRLAALFAETGSLVDPFTVTPTGQPFRYDGRAAVQQWYAERFAQVPWLALRLQSIQAGRQPNQLVATWSYMDPRIEQPLEGKNYFTLAAGEIFETRLELVSSLPGSEPATAAADAGAATSAPAASANATTEQPAAERPRRGRGRRAQPAPQAPAQPAQ